MSYFEKSESLKNPATKFISWNASEGNFAYWDKENKQNVSLGDEMVILPLKQLSTIKGYHKQLEGGFVANEVSNTTTEELNVRVFVKNSKGESKQQPFEFGLYKDIKDKIKTAGGKFSISLYCLLVSDLTGKTELVNVQFYGASLSPFIDLGREVVDSGAMIHCTKNPEIQKNGGVKYYVPNFRAGRIDEALLESAKPFYEDLQNYFVSYKEAQTVKAESEIEDNKIANIANEAVADMPLPDINIDDINVVMPF
jgi:hypothetical protein